MPAAITFEGVSKVYRGAGYRSLRDELVRLVPGKRPTPRTEIQALDDVSLTIPEGESFAVLGLNGAGKTTALKIASRIAYPTTGRVTVRGRVGALIEVGTGMHPELTGRENIDLYGRILGLSRHAVRRRFDEIVDFADIGSAIDQPVKQFSSGMQLRLGFAIAAHLEPDVLLVDEAIAVGDVGFQYKCVERMSKLVREGHTLVFVSHDATAVETLCERAVLLDRGHLIDDGPAREVLTHYLHEAQARRFGDDATEGVVEGQQLSIQNVTLHDDGEEPVTEIRPGQRLRVRLHYRAPLPVIRPVFSLGLSDGRHGWFSVASMLVDDSTPERLEGSGYVECRFGELPLNPHTYEIWGEVRAESGYGYLVEWQRLARFDVKDLMTGAGKAVVSVQTAAPIRLAYEWTVIPGDGAV